MRNDVIVDLSHAIRHRMPMAPRLPPPRIEPFISHAASRPTYEGRAEFEITRFFFVGNTGTSLDSPRHRSPEASDVSEIPLDRLVDVPGVVIDADATGAGPRIVADVQGSGRPIGGHAVLFRTGWDRNWGQHRYWSDGPWLDARVVELLVTEQPALVAVDFGNVDRLTDPDRTAHTALLQAGIPIVENLRGLDRLGVSPFTFSCPPLPIEGASIPVRAFARLGQPQGGR